MRGILKAFMWIGCFLYAIQVLLIASWRLSPLLEKEVDGKRYVLIRGYGDGADFVPLAGAFPVLGETVTLRIDDLTTGDRTVKNYDDESTAHSELPTIIPNPAGRF
jgi:hypothetical protein